MDDLIINGKATTQEMVGEPIVNYDNTFRIYKISPEAFGLQIRSNGPICHKGKCRRLTAHIAVSESDLKEMLAQLSKIV